MCLHVRDQAIALLVVTPRIPCALDDVRADDVTEALYDTLRRQSGLGVVIPALLDGGAQEMNALNTHTHTVSLHLRSYIIIHLHGIRKVLIMGITIWPNVIIILQKAVMELNKIYC